MIRRFVALMTSAALVISTMPAPLGAQPAPAPVAAPDQTQQGEQFSTAQLEALMAPIALYPDALLTQLLMATTNPLEIVSASRWLAQGSNRQLTGKALEDALRNQPWDPAVKSLIPFPQVLEMLNQQLEWTQQLGYAMQNQETEVFDALQRLRARAQTAGTLQTTPQQIVSTEAAPPPPPGATDPRQQNIVIEPADPNLVYVPSYDPSQVYGTWPYADVPPVYYAPLPGYGYQGGLVAGLVFGAGVAIAAAALWGWARPNWGCCWGGRYGGVNVNVNRWNAISPRRPWRGGGGAWHANNPGLRPRGGMARPSGPVGRPVRPIGSPGVRDAAAAWPSAGQWHWSPRRSRRTSAGRTRCSGIVARRSGPSAGNTWSWISWLWISWRSRATTGLHSRSGWQARAPRPRQPPWSAAGSGKPAGGTRSGHSTRHAAARPAAAHPATTRQAGDHPAAAAPECAARPGSGGTAGSRTDCTASPRTQAGHRAPGSAAAGLPGTSRRPGRGRQASLRGGRPRTGISGAICRRRRCHGDLLLL